LKVEAAAWLEDGSCVCDQCPGEDELVQNEVHALLICQDHRVCELRKHFSFLFTPFFEDFSAAQPFLLQQVNNQLVHDFLSQQNNRLFLFLLSLWIYLWLAETSQQPISQTTWLKVTPHCNHCNHLNSPVYVRLMMMSRMKSMFSSTAHTLRWSLSAGSTRLHFYTWTTIKLFFTNLLYCMNKRAVIVLTKAFSL
jgi:hypothetical protein